MERGVHSRAKLILVAMTLANAMILVDQTAVPLAIPSILKQFGISSTTAQWVLNANLLTLAGLLVLGGRLGDLFGRRRMFILGAVLFTSASAFGGLAPKFEILLAARVVQGAGGALMLPSSVAILSASISSAERGRALGTMGGVAGIAGALGPSIGGLLTSAASWRLVLLVNVPIAIVCLTVTLIAVPNDAPADAPESVDLLGALLLCVSIVALVFGLSQTQESGFVSAPVLGALLLCAVATVVFVLHEGRTARPLMDLDLLGHTPNYLGAGLSQGAAGMAEMGLGLLFPLLLILNLGMSPAVAGLALIPTTVPMILLSTVAGRWYDRAGGRPPLVVGFGTLAVAGVALFLGAWGGSYWTLLPGLLLFGTGLALVLTVNDPVSLDSVSDAQDGEVSGVSATAEQAGGAIGIALLYSLFHAVYLHRLTSLVDAEPGGKFSAKEGLQLRNALQAAEQTGLQPKHFNQSLVRFLQPANDASIRGYGAAFLAVTVIAIGAAVVTGILVRRPPALAASDDSDPALNAE
jgi:EmrB/QacA subfamily drug resistance transporter